MKPRISGLLGVLAALVSGATACKKDPTAEGVGTPSAVIADFSAFTLPVGDSARFTATVVDDRLTPLAEPISFSSCDNTTATVAVDPTFTAVPPTRVRAVIHAVGPNAVCIIASSGSAKPDTVHVIVLPVSFNGALSSSTPSGGSSLVIKSTSLLKFIPASATVTFGGDIAGVVNVATVDSLVVAVPFSDPGKLTITGISLTYLAGSNVTLTSSGTVTQTGRFWAGDSSYATAPTIAIPAAAGKSVGFITNFGPPNVAMCAEGGETGPCMIYKFVTTATTSLKFSTNWDGAALAPDVDIYVCPSPQAVPADLATCGSVGGFGGATASKPQVINAFNYPAGTYYLVVEIYDNSATARNITTTITRN